MVEKPDKPRGNAAKAYAAAAVRHEAEYYIPIEHHNPMELFASTVVWNDGGKLTVFDKTQGVQNVQRYICGIFGLKAGRRARHVAFCRRRIRLGLAAAISGGVGGAGCASAEARREARTDEGSDVRPRLSAGDDRACGDRRRGTMERSTRSPMKRSP